MTWFLIVILALVVVLALIAVVLLIAYVTDEMDDERSRIDMEVRRAERRLHDIASHSFESMLAEARSNDRVS
jgi:predicted Holliday junction resolvase-like endonuclease